VKSLIVQRFVSNFWPIGEQCPRGDHLATSVLNSSIELCSSGSGVTI
jgi:hypothetical protein